MYQHPKMFTCEVVSLEVPNEQLVMGMGHCKKCSCQAYEPFGSPGDTCARTSCQHSINDHA
jgi:hypothetical protein